MKKTAIILGATGLTGSILLEKLLSDDRYSKVKLFGRKTVPISHDKLEQHIVDLLELEKHSEIFHADDVFCCIGTTKKKTPDQKEYRKIDFGIPVVTGKLCKENDIKTFAVISSIGAKAGSSNFYLKTKGEMENAVLEYEIPNTIILRPSLIVGDRQEKRAGEKLSIVMMKLFNPLMFGGMKKYRSIDARTIVSVMVHLANNPIDMKVIESNLIQEIATTEIDN